LDLINPHDADQMAHSRSRYRSYRQQGHRLEYWRQDDNGGWQLKESTHQVNEG
ncbi:MAG: hypothetical protein HQL60_06835, partial [Magnetococcales bacterium]|nr:hypothetical protein [Magnetococcales bacterium]